MQVVFLAYSAMCCVYRYRVCVCVCVCVCVIKHLVDRTEVVSVLTHLHKIPEHLSQLHDSRYGLSCM